MGLRVVISKEDLRQELVMACYIVTGLYGSDCLFAMALKTLVDWVEYKKDNLSQTHSLRTPLGP